MKEESATWIAGLARKLLGSTERRSEGEGYAMEKEAKKAIAALNAMKGSVEELRREIGAIQNELQKAYPPEGPHVQVALAPKKGEDWTIAWESLPGEGKGPIFVYTFWTDDDPVGADRVLLEEPPDYFIPAAERIPELITKIKKETEQKKGTLERVIVKLKQTRRTEKI